MPNRDLPFCRKCGRALTNPESVELGIGPVCLSKEIRQNRPKRIILYSAVIPRLLDLEEEENADAEG